MLLVLEPDGPVGEAAFGTGLVAVGRIGGTSTCWMPFFACIEALIRAAAAAAAAAGSAGLLAPSVAGLDTFADFEGLLLRRVSECLLTGDRERLSKREDRLISGSV